MLSTHSLFYHEKLGHCHWVCRESWAHKRLFNLPPQLSRLGTQPRPRSQGWAPSPAPVLKAGHPAPHQLSRLGTQPRTSSQGWAPSPAPVLKAGHPAPHQLSRLGTQPRTSSQGWAPSPAPVLKAGHPAPPPAPPQSSRLGTQPHPQPRPSSQGWAPRVLLSCFSVLHVVSSVLYVHLRFFLFFFLTFL